MSKKDIAKGIEIQAKADAEREKKESAALNHLISIIQETKGNQSSLRKIVGIILEDLKAMELRHKYGLNSMLTPLDLDDETKNYLMSILYSLFSKEENNSEFQKKYYLNLEEYIEIINRNDNCDYTKLNNIDSHSDRMIVLESICSFLFLSKCDFSFRTNDEYKWINDFAIDKDLDAVCDIIQKEFDTLGADGIVNKYRKQEIQPIDNKKDEVDEDDTENNVIESEPNNDPYNGLRALVESYVVDESSFGKDQSKNPKSALRDIKKTFPKLGTNAIISITKIGNGYLVFTTSALYLKATDKFNGHYLRIPYHNIDVENISFGLGKIKDTRKIVIPYKDENGTEKTAIIDDAKLTEEKLSDLLKDIQSSNVAIASNDMYSNLPDLSMELKELYFKALGNILVREGYNLIELYLEMIDYGMESKWNDIASSFDKNDELENNIKSFLDTIPYPSKDVISQQAILLALQTICRTNRVEGTEVSTLYDEDEELIRLFDTNHMDQKTFTKHLTFATKSKRTINFNDIFYIMERMPKDTLFYENLNDGANKFAEVVKSEVEKRRNSFPNRFINAVEEKREDLANVAVSVLKKARLSIGNKNDTKIVIPDDYKKGKKVPAEFGLPKDAEMFSVVSENGNGIIIRYDVTEEQTMPFDNPQWVIDMLHNTMGDNEGIIEVNNGVTTKGRPYIYEIIKHHIQDQEGFPGKMEYTLNINVRFADSIQFINGSFSEGNTTGIRESIVYAAYMNAKDKNPEDVDEFYYDPYDSNYTKGLRMNISEREGLDDEFPWHPLSMCRNLVKYIVENN